MWYGFRNCNSPFMNTCISCHLQWKSCLISTPFLSTYIDVRTLNFFPPAESWLVNLNFPHASMQGCGVSFHCLRRLSSESVRLFGGFYRRCCGNANIEGTGFNLARPRPPSKWTEHILVGLVTFKLSRRQAAIHRVHRSCSGIPAA